MPSRGLNIPQCRQNLQCSGESLDLPCGFTHCERKSPLVAAARDIRGTMGRVTVAHHSQIRIALVARRHIDFKRVCSCCCPA